MRNIIIAIVIMAFQNIYAQDKSIVNEILDYYKNTDFSYFVEKCQKHIDEYDKWVEDSFMATWPEYFFYDGHAIKNGMEPDHKSSHLNLTKEKKQFFLSISFMDMKNLSRTDNIYDHIVIDSLRNFVVACMDDNGKVKGYVNYDHLGSYTKVEEFIFFGKKNKRKKVYENEKNIVSILNSFHPQALLINTGLGHNFYYLKNYKIYVYDLSREKSMELVDFANEMPLVYLRTFGHHLINKTCQ